MSKKIVRIWSEDGTDNKFMEPPDKVTEIEIIMLVEKAKSTASNWADIEEKLTSLGFIKLSIIEGPVWNI